MLSKRLKEIGELLGLSDDEQSCCNHAAAVCAAVEAFQAAAQAVEAAYAKRMESCARFAEWEHRKVEADAAEARLLEVNLC